NHPLRTQVLRIGSDLDEGKTNSFRLWQQQTQRKCGVASALLPRNHCIPNMAEAVRWQGRCTGLPPKPNASTELAIPQPAAKPGQASHDRTIRKRDRRALRFAIYEAGE